MYRKYASVCSAIAKGYCATKTSEIAFLVYQASGPFINTQECPEYRDLVDKYQMGFNCENNNAKDLADKLFVLCKDDLLRKTMGLNSRRLAEDRFDRKKTYKEILELLKTANSKCR